MKVLFILGTRPEAIKLAPLILAMKKDLFFKTSVCVTGQHRQMLDQVLSIFHIVPEYDLDLMSNDQSVAGFAAKAINAIDEVIRLSKPDLTMVQGDTTTAFAGALCSYYNRVKVAHVEAGLRTYNKLAPFPEEVNRALITHTGDIHFAPTERSKENLLKENIQGNSILVTGNTVIDALTLIKEKLRKNELMVEDESVRKILEDDSRFILVTAHRRENFGAGIQSVTRAIKRFAKHFPDVRVVFPVHMNPNVSDTVFKELDAIQNVKLLQPVDYISLLGLLSKCYFVVSDSGGIQEEAPAFLKPVIVLRESTERPEVVESGFAKLVGTDEEKIFDALSLLINDQSAYKKMSTGINPFGDGRASDRIIAHLKQWNA